MNKLALALKSSHSPENGSRPKILLTAVHHATELFGTYNSVDALCNSRPEDIIGIPIVDKANFAKNTQALKNIDDTLGLYHSVKEGNGLLNRDENIWSYGKNYPKLKEVEQIIDIIPKGGLVIDLHNWVREEYAFVSKPIGSKFDENLKRSDFGRQFTGHLGLNYKKTRNGLFEPLGETNICSYVARKGLNNVAIEIPCFKIVGEKIYLNEERIIIEDVVGLANQIISLYLER